LHTETKPNPNPNANTNPNLNPITPINRHTVTSDIGCLIKTFTYLHTYSFTKP